MVRQLERTARYQHWDLLAAAVMVDHVHAVVDFAADTDRALAIDSMGRFKAYASRALNAAAVRREQWWTRGGSRRSLMSEHAVVAAVRYVAQQNGCLALAVGPEWGAADEGDRQ